MNDEEREERRAQMRKCLEIAMDVWTLISDAQAGGADEVHIDQVTAVIKERFAVPLHKTRIDAVGYSIATAMNKYDLTSCGLWSLAHNLDHCLFEDDLSEVEAVLAAMR